MLFRRFCVAFLLLFLATAALAQNATTTLHGVVADATGALIAGATVTIDNPANGVHNQTTTNKSGEYAFQQVQPGKYTVTFSAPGFGKYTATATLEVSLPATVDAKLQVNVDVTNVDVSASTETINTTDATIGNVINNQQIMQLPSDARNVQTLLGLQPGVLFIGTDPTGGGDNRDSRNGAVSGARPDQTNLTLDGIDNNNQFAPAPFTGVLRISLDATQEFRVTTSNANADQGRSSGGQASILTKAGTNTVHGTVYEYNRSNIFEANDPFNKAAQLASGQPNTPIHLIRNTYGIALGGPIKKDRIFLFGNYEGNRQNEGRSATRTVPLDSLRTGSLNYLDKSGNQVTLTPQQVASIDTNCRGTGTCAYGGGPNPASLALFALYPHANGALTGDGINSGSFTFGASLPVLQNEYIARFDFNPNDRNQIYVRGSFQNDSNSAAPLFPGQSPQSVSTDDSRGIAVNYTHTFNSNLINNARYGFVRQSFATTGAGSGQYVTFRTLDLPVASTRSSKSLIPLHNAADDLTWTKGRHSLQLGFNYRTYNYQNQTDANSYGNANSNPYWLKNSGFASGGTLDPTRIPGNPAVSDKADYNFAAAALVGIVAEETQNYNYSLNSAGTSGNLLNLGVPVARSFRANELEYYVQDSYRPTPNLTLTLGIRHTILQTPYETNGQQVRPTVIGSNESIHQWFANRGAGAAAGQSVQPELQFVAGGQARGGAAFFPMNWGNIAPRFALAWQPVTEEGSFFNKIFGAAGKSSIRAGFGIYYDHFGEGLVADYSQRGSFGLSSQITNPSSTLSYDTAPRFTDLHTLPNLLPAGQATVGYPQIPSDDPNGTGFAITTGIDDRQHTPYSEVFNLSFQRELKGGFTFEADYVGRLGRHLIQQLDLAQPLDLVDPKSGMDYYTAATMFSKAMDAGLDSVGPIPYWENLFANAADPANGLTATNSVYQNAYLGTRGNETAGLQLLDAFCYPGCANGKTGQYWPLQYSSLYSYATIGSSSYHAGQFLLRHPASHGVQFDFSYTYSKSLDLGSDSEYNSAGSGYTFGPIQDAFNPQKNYSVSDFDTKHIVTADWVLQLPYGPGQHWGGSAPYWANTLVGGWSLSGIARWTSGLPFSTGTDGWPTNWEYQPFAVKTGPVATKTHLTAAGPQAFADPAIAGLGANERFTYPGEAGQRNVFRGDGYFGVDMGLHKRFAFGERANLELAGEIFNISNSVRYDVHSISGQIDSGSLGVYSSTLNQYRHAQFSGRFTF